MSVIDDFTSYHEELLEGHYDCVDRIVVNAYFEYAQSAGGFRSWWRTWMGSDETLDRAHLERVAGRFKRRLEAYAKKNKIPFLLCEAGERKHEKAEPYLPQVPDFKGVFLILIGRAPAPVWEVERNRKIQITNLYRKKKWPYVNHYHIHLIDPDWGHVTIRICGYPPFGAQVIANGHEWVERQARKRSLPVKKEGNCFTGGTDFQALNQIAKTLRAAHAVGRLTKVCDRRGVPPEKIVTSRKSFRKRRYTTSRNPLNRVPILAAPRLKRLCSGAMKEFISQHQERIHGVLSCFDRMLFRGYLPIMSGWQMAQFFNSSKIRFPELKGFLLQHAERVKQQFFESVQFATVRG